jgi:general secretion pathway protein G
MTVLNRKQRALRAASRGLTLVELVIVITLIGLLTAAIAVGVMKIRADGMVGAAKTACGTLRQATLAYLNKNTGADCPSPEQLKKERQVDETFDIKDPWGQPYKIACESDESIRVSSSGPDKKENTEDDIRVPDPGKK